MLINIVIGLVAFSVIVIVHELGHFITAKASGVRVEEFALGLPPRIFGIKRGETVYALNAIPFGGYNKVTGEEDPKLSKSLASKSIGIRLLFFCAGSLMNFLLAFLLFSIVFMIPHDVVTEPVMVEKVFPNSPAAMAGIEPGDSIIGINEHPVSNIATLQRYLNLNLGREVALLIQHSDSATEEVQVIPRWEPPEGQGATGMNLDIEIARSNRTTVRQSEPPWKAIPLGTKKCVENVVLYKNGIISVIIGTASAIMVGPVGIAQMTGEVATKVGISPLLEFAALLSLLLGIFNLFPIPALDGGRIAFVLLEWVRRGKRVSPRTEGLIHTIGFFLLIATMLAFTYQDIIRIISGGSIIP